MRLTSYGFGHEPLGIGGLEGNAFRLVVRNLPFELGEQLQKTRKLNHLFVNYYDIQRFGVPGGPRRTHLVGQAILRSNWGAALRELIGLAAPESQSAADWAGTAEDFFRALDPRTTSFYLAAAASWDWNCELREVIDRAGTRADVLDVEVEGLDYRYLRSGRQLQQVLAEQADLAYRRYSFDDGVVTFRESSRPTVIQTQIALGERWDDEFHPGRSAVEFRFFLPSGCYATAAIRQLLARTDLAIDARSIPAVG
jgi:tRNA pseudouridine13 synthase